MATDYSAVLGEQENQIGIHPTDNSGLINGLANGVGAVLGAFASSKKDSVIEQHIKEVSDLSDKLGAAMKQGSITPTQYYTQLSAKQKEFAVNHPQYAELARARLKDSLGTLPTEGAAQQNAGFAKEDNDLQGKELEGAAQLGVRVTKPDGTTDTQKTIKNFRDVMQAENQLKLAKGLTGEDADKQRGIAVRGAFGQFWNANVGPGLNNIQKIASATGGKNGQAYNDSQAAFEKLRGQWNNWQRGKLNEATLSSTQAKAISDEFNGQWDTLKEYLFKGDMATFNQRIDAVNHGINDGAADMSSKLGGIPMLNKALGGGDQTVANLMGGVLLSNDKARNTIQQTYDAGLRSYAAGNPAVNINDTADSINAGKTPDVMAPERRSAVAGSLYKVVKGLASSPIDLSPADAVNFSKATSALSHVTTNHGTSKDTSQVVNNLNNNTFYTQLDKAAKNENTRKDAMQAADDATGMAFSNLTNQMREANAVIEENRNLPFYHPLSGADFPLQIQFNQGKGTFEVAADPKAPINADNKDKTFKNINLGSKELQTYIGNLNNSIDMFTKLQRIKGVTQGSDLQMKQGLAASMGFALNPNYQGGIPKEVESVFTKGGTAQQPAAEPKRIRIKLSPDGNGFEVQ